MEASTLDWLITLLAVHVLALAGVIHMFRGAPCWMQRMAIGLLIVAFILFCVAYIAALAHVDNWWAFLVVAAVLEHHAVLLYVFRIVWQGSGHGYADRTAAKVR